MPQKRAAIFGNVSPAWFTLPYATGCCTGTPELLQASRTLLPTGLEAGEDSGLFWCENPDAGVNGQGAALGQDTGAEASARVGAAQDGAGTGCHGGEERAVGAFRGAHTAALPRAAWGRAGPPHPARCQPGRCQDRPWGPGRCDGGTRHPGTCPSLPFQVQRSCSPLLPPGYGQGSIQEALSSSHFSPVG